MSSRDNHHHDHHHHDHDPDCDCGCHHLNHDPGFHHSGAEKIVEDALVFSKKGNLNITYSCSAEEALSYALEGIRGIAEIVAVDGVVLGHIKALLECEAGKTTLSITRVDSPDITKHEGWNGKKQIRACSLSANVLTLANTDIPVEDMIARIIT